MEPDSVDNQHRTDGAQSAQQAQATGASRASRANHAAAADASGVPIRGIAMILLAVIVLLLAWGVYTLVGSGKEEAPHAASTAGSTSSVQAPAGAATAVPQASAAPAPSGVNPVTSSAAPAASASAGVNPGAAAGDPSAVPVHALNNSTVPGLANRIAAELKKDGFSQVDSGNFPKENLPNSVAFFTAGNAAEEQAANLMAQKLKIKAQPRSEAVRDLPAGVIVVITEDLNR